MTAEAPLVVVRRVEERAVSSDRAALSAWLDGRKAELRRDGTGVLWSCLMVAGPPEQWYAEVRYGSEATPDEARS